MDFYGRYEYSVDKNRILVPPELRYVEQFYTIISDPKSLDFPLLVKWLDLKPYNYISLFDSLPSFPIELEWYLKQNTIIIKPDKYNRVLIPKLKLGDKAYFLGIGDRAEIWSIIEWNKKVSRDIY